MRDLTQTETVKLEELIDATSVSAVLDAIALIAREKVDHILESYTDVPLAKLWQEAARTIEQTAKTKAIRSLP